MAYTHEIATMTAAVTFLSLATNYTVVSEKEGERDLRNSLGEAARKCKERYRFAVGVGAVAMCKVCSGEDDFVVACGFFGSGNVRKCEDNWTLIIRLR